MRRLLILTLLAFCFSPCAWAAEEYRVEAFEAPPPEELSKEVAAELAPAGFKVLRGEKRTLCEVWLRKQLPTKENFTASATILYPFVPGELFGAIRFKRKLSDFRNQEIPSGVYTLRYALQPVDGNHVGTSITRDFLLLISAEVDKAPKAMPEKEMSKLSAQSAETSHPAMLSLVSPSDAGAAGPLPTMRHVKANDWWTVLFDAKDTTGKSVLVEMVIVGHTAE